MCGVNEAYRIVLGVIIKILIPCRVPTSKNILSRTRLETRLKNTKGCRRIGYFVPQKLWEMPEHTFMSQPVPLSRQKKRARKQRKETQA